METKPDHDPDVHLFLNRFKPSDEDVQARYELLSRLIEILKERFGSGFHVEYVGLGRHATIIKQAPFEVAIIDVQSELGVVGRDYTSHPPDIYNPLAVIKALESKGFHGYINNHSLSRTVTRKLPAAEEYVRPHTEDIKDQEWFWFTRRGLVYPERLHIESPIAFDLILPGPATTSLVRMLEKYSELFPAFRDLVSVSYLWCHSLGMTEISPTCLALLFVSFLQV